MSEFSDYEQRLLDERLKIHEKAINESYQDGYHSGYDDGWASCFDVIKALGINVDDYRTLPSRPDACAFTDDLFGFNP